jgi:hypothetical protein
MGADGILRRHLGLAEDYVLPLALSHGIDFGCYKAVQDLYSLEPIYWAYNARSFDLARKVKPALLIPHPLLLELKGRDLPPGSGSLVVGPPPGPSNDRGLADTLERHRIADATILVKPFPGFDKSVAFWRSRGFSVVSLADEGPPSYDRVIDLFSRYDHFIGGTVSSALFMAAALGRRISLLPDYTYAGFESLGIHEIIDFGSRIAADNVRTLMSGDVASTTLMARNLLGAEIDDDPRRIKADLDEAIAGLRHPIYCALPYPQPVKAAATEIALRMNRPGLVSQTIPQIIRGRLKREVLIHTLNEVTMFTDGPNSTNLQVSRAPYIPGVTEPGFAVDLY